MGCSPFFFQHVSLLSIHLTFMHWAIPGSIELGASAFRVLYMQFKMGDAHFSQ